MLLTLGVLLWVGALVVKAVGSEDRELQRLANKAQVVGVALAVIPLVLNAIVGLWQRLRGVPIQRDPGELLALRVRLGQEQARHALLGDAAAANLTFNIGGTVRQHGPEPEPGMLERLRRLVRYRPEHGGPEADMASIADFYTDLEPRRLVILGEPGSGKTVLAIELILQLLTRLGDSDGLPGGAVPVRASLAGWDPNRPLEEWLVERLTVDYELSPVNAKALVEERRVLPVLDGLDEMDPDPTLGQAGQPPARALAALAKLNAYLHGPQRAAVVLTCRQHRYTQVEQAGAGLRDATHIRILPLDAEQIRGYLTTRFPGAARLEAWQPVLDSLNGAAGAVAREVLSTPWRLHLATTLSQTDRWAPAELHRVGPDEDLQSAVRRIEGLLLAGYVPAATQWAAQRPSSRRYDPAKVTTWLQNLAIHLDWQGRLAGRLVNPPPGLSGTDLIPHLLWPVGGWRRIRYLHATIGVALIAAATSAIALVVIGPPRVWLDNIRRWFADIGAQPLPYLVSQFLALIGLVGFAVYLSKECLELWPAPSAIVRVPVRARLTSGIAGMVVYGLGWGLAAGLVIGLGFGLETGLAAGLVAALAAGLGSGLAGGFGAGLQPWTQDVDVASPRLPLRVDVVAALAFGLVGGLGIALSFMLLRGIGMETWAELKIALPAGLAAGCALSFATGSTSWLRYVLGLAGAATARKLPWRLGSFLDWACTAGLLRVSGTAYQFRHLELQRWLAHQQQAAPIPPAEIAS